MPRARCGRPAAADPRGPRRRGLRAPLPDRRRAGDVAVGRRGRAAAAAQPVRGQQGRAGALRAGVGGGDRRLGGGAALSQRLRPAHAARHTRTPGWPRSSGRQSKEGDAPRVFEDGGQMRDFVHVDDVAAANVAAVDADPAGFAAFNVCSGRPISIMEVATELCDARGGAARPWSPASTAAATSATSWPIPPRRPSCWDSGRRSTRPTGCGSSRSRRCEADDRSRRSRGDVAERITGTGEKPAICEQFGIDFPLFAFSHCRDVVAAVTNAGGFGVLGGDGATHPSNWTRS